MLLCMTTAGRQSVKRIVDDSKKSDGRYDEKVILTDIRVRKIV